jgi:hypothetical protein
MGIREGQRSIATVVSDAVHDRLHAVATARGTSVSAMLAAWLEAGVGEPLDKAGKRQTVRRVKPDELFVSLPRDFTRRAGLAKGSTVAVSYSDDALVVTRA